MLREGEESRWRGWRAISFCVGDDISIIRRGSEASDVKDGDWIISKLIFIKSSYFNSNEAMKRCLHELGGQQNRGFI